MTDYYVNFLIINQYSMILSVGQMTNYDTTVNDPSRVEYLQAFIGGLLDSVRYDCFGFVGAALFTGTFFMDGNNLQGRIKHKGLLCLVIRGCIRAIVWLQLHFRPLLCEF